MTQVMTHAVLWWWKDKTKKNEQDKNHFFFFFLCFCWVAVSLCACGDEGHPSSNSFNTPSLFLLNLSLFTVSTISFSFSNGLQEATSFCRKKNDPHVLCRSDARPLDRAGPSSLALDTTFTSTCSYTSFNTQRTRKRPVLCCTRKRQLSTGRLCASCARERLQCERSGCD